MKVYFISGLGADENVFRHIRLQQPHEAVFLPWIRPEKNESLVHYAMRMAESINEKEPFALVGLSLGGMVATEIAKALQPQKTILISSIPVSSCLPFYYRWSGFLRLHRIVPVSLFQHLSFLKRFFTTETREDKAILRNMIRNCDPSFIRWSMDAALKWKNETIPPNLYQIHGSADGILPMRFTRPQYIIKKAGHLMVMNRARVINQILVEILK